jgi:hypothetical protein
VVVGDSKQKDIGNLSGFEKVLTSFVGTDCEEQGIQTITFGPEEIVRSQILRFIVKKLGC